MLIRLHGKNFRSFRDYFELSLVAADFPADGNRGVVSLPLRGIDKPFPVLRTAAIYGPNASGKSTILLAAQALRWLVMDSARMDIDDSLRYYEPFLFDADTSSSPVELGCTFWHPDDQELYGYEVSYSAIQVETERLYRLSEPELSIFQRDNSGQVTGSLVESSPQTSVMLEQPRANATVFSYLAQLGPKSGESSIVPYYRTLNEVLRFHDFQNPRSRMGWPFYRNRQANKLHDNKEYKEWVLEHLIKPADLGIEDIVTNVIEKGERSIRKIRDSKGEIKEAVHQEPDRVKVEFQHAGRSVANLGLQNESAGTQKMYNLAEYWHELAFNNRCYFMDELSASLHPHLLDKMIRAINLGAEDTRRSQVVFTTHDTSLLESRSEEFPAIRRDQVYFTEKSDDGSSTLQSLAEFKERSVHNLRRRYMSGRYGAIPDISTLKL